jgi:hypothetical protein
MKNTTQELVRRTCGRDNSLTAKDGNNYLDGGEGSNTLLADGGGLFGQNKFKAANDAEERMAA